ncbi:DUF6538 domain-containing protein [Microbulbifer taiwanensis]|uniref:DUF6538 domain-containing protein n=1 Tax=Microbulbifer taiwanensis TaxID=986746 RepID=A0ABW1YRI3_9GAMM
MAKPSKSTPSYLTTNRVGTYVFQVRIPKRIRQNSSNAKSTLWRSLGTKDKSEAIQLVPSDRGGRRLDLPR